MKMYPHPSGRYINPLQVTNCHIIQIEKNIYQAVYEFGDTNVLFSHSTAEEARKDLQDFVEFCAEC